jgi:cytochrome c556
MPSRRTSALVLLITTCAFAGAAQAQAAKPEQVLKYRKALYSVIGWNFGPMSAMAQGKVPYDAAEFARRAERVAFVAPLLGEAFPVESKGVANSELKPEMWANRADFDAKMQDMVERSVTLAKVAKSGDFEQSKAAFLQTAQTCKACHDKYKND